MKTLVERLSLLALKEGENKTNLDGVTIYKASQSIKKIPLCYSQGLIIVVQGNKKVYLENEIYTYNPDNYLVLTLPLPAECETIVEPGKPLLSLMIDFDLSQLNELVRLFDEHHMTSSLSSSKVTKGLYVSQCNFELMDVVDRLVDCLSSPLKSSVLGPGLVREVMFELLHGPQSSSLFELVSHNTQLARLEKVLKHLHDNFAQSLDVDKLAKMANMSQSTFHRNFKQMTASSPIQYVKKIRLNRARELLQDQGLRVKQAASQVGYESPSQFSREFKRYFGASPQQQARAIGLQN